MDSFLTKILDALNPNGVFITLSDGLADERTKPELMVTGWLPMALTGQDMGFDQGIIADSMLFESGSDWCGHARRRCRWVRWTLISGGNRLKNSYFQNPDTRPLFNTYVGHIFEVQTRFS